MPLNNYGVLKGRPIANLDGLGSNPHYQIHIIDETTDYRIAVNVKSKLAPSELLFTVIEHFDHPITAVLAHLDLGFTTIDSVPNGLGLDYIRGNLFQPALMQPLAHDVAGPDNDLNEKLDHYINRAQRDETATVYAFGERWGPENNRRDKYFGFLPGNGIHDIHMNQGNSEQFKKDDGVWQDGGLLIHFPSIHQWVAVFLAFQSQAWHTNDNTGHAFDSLPPTVEKESHIRIVAALVNPAGGDVGHEKVGLLNVSPKPLDIGGWMIADRNKRKEHIPNQVLSPSEFAYITLSGQGAQLSNKGGVITLLDPHGLKVHGVSYTRQQAKKAEWTIIF